MTKDKIKRDCPSCLAFGKHCPHKVNGDPYYYNCTMTVEALEKENAELKGIKDIATLIRANNDTVITLMQLNNMLVSKNQQLTKAKEIIRDLIQVLPKENLKVFMKLLKKQSNS